MIFNGNIYFNPMIATTVFKTEILNLRELRVCKKIAEKIKCTNITESTMALDMPDSLSPVVAIRRIIVIKGTMQQSPNKMR